MSKSNDIDRASAHAVVTRFFEQRFHQSRPGKPENFPREKFRDMTILGLDLVDTCTSHPEQYDVFLADLPIGYLRMRHSCFRVDVPYCGGDIIRMTEPKGSGAFEDDEREAELTEAVRAIIQWWLKSV